MTTRVRSYTELMQLETFEERYRYLALRGHVGSATFGFDRYMNQKFYESIEWKQIRHHVIARDLGCDLAHTLQEIHNRLYIHHMNPMVPADIVGGESSILDPEYLITTTHRTHNAIHYGNENLLAKPMIVRRAGDTKLW